MRILIICFALAQANAFLLPGLIPNIAARKLNGDFTPRFHGPSMHLSNAGTSEHRITKRAFIFSLFASTVLQSAAPALAESKIAGEGSVSADEQIIDVDQINGKKLAVLGGALFVADLLSGALTGRSVLRIVGNDKAGVPKWQQEVLDNLLEKEKKEAAERMGISTTISEKPRAPSATGDYAANDPLEIAKQRYKKKESIEDLQRNLRDKLDGKPSLGFDKPDEE